MLNGPHNMMSLLSGSSPLVVRLKSNSMGYHLPELEAAGLALLSGIVGNLIIDVKE